MKNGFRYGHGNSDSYNLKNIGTSTLLHIWYYLTFIYIVEKVKSILMNDFNSSFITLLKYMLNSFTCVWNLSKKCIRCVEVKNKSMFFWNPCLNFRRYCNEYHTGVVHRFKESRSKRRNNFFGYTCLTLPTCVVRVLHKCRTPRHVCPCFIVWYLFYKKHTN